MEKTLKKGDDVSWKSSGGTSHGTVVKKITGTASVKGHTAHASKSDPQYEVVSETSGAHAIHKPESLKKK